MVMFTIIETMNQNPILPSIRLKEEPGTLLLSILFKSLNPRWGNVDSHLSRMVLDYFRFIVLRPEYTSTIQEFSQQNISEEVLYQLALTYNHHERNDFILKDLNRTTGIPMPTLMQHQYALLKTLASFKTTVDSSPLRQLFTTFQTKDTHERLETMDQLKEELAQAYQFFNPNISQSEFIFTPSDPLFSEYIGHSINLSARQIVFLTHNSQVKTQIYQILRTILQPILKPLVSQLSPAQKQQIHDMSSGKMRQLYGPNSFDLLLSEIITLYYNNLRTHQPLEDFPAFQARVNKITDKNFLRSLEGNSHLRLRCEYLQIHTLVDFKVRLREYYDTFYRDELANRLIRLLQNYDVQKDNISFQQFMTNNFAKIFVV